MSQLNLGPQEDIIDGRHVRRIVISRATNTLLAPNSDGNIMAELGDTVVTTSVEIPRIPGERPAMALIGKVSENRRVAIVRLPHFHPAITENEIAFLGFRY